MEPHYQLSDAEFEKQFAACELSASLFSHEAHLRLAWIHIHRYGIDRAIDNIQHQLQGYVRHLGATDKYHQSLTVAAVYAVNHFSKKSKSKCFEDFIAEFPQLKTNFKSLINSHYSFDIFESPLARKEFIEPDVQAFI